MKAALLALVLTGCAVCRVHPKPDVPPGVEATAFIDQGQECWTVDVRPSGAAVLQIIATVLKTTLGAVGD